MTRRQGSEMAQNTLGNVLQESDQAPETRRGLLRAIGKRMDREVVSYFTSFMHPVMIDDGDADTLECVLSSLDLSKRILLVLSSPGGDALAAERIITVCRAHSPDGKYEVLVPRRAKSAAAMICMGAEVIYMSETSELGPIDPQHIVPKGDSFARVSVHSIVESYKDLLADAVATTGNPNPYIALLSQYNPAEVRELELAQALSEDIAVKALKSGSRSADDEDAIKNAIGIFTNPVEKKSHGRQITREQARAAGLPISDMSVKSDEWKQVEELYIRTDFYLTKPASKTIETSRQSFSVSAPGGGPR